jgi:SAM-dependent methyltransferase
MLPFWSRLAHSYANLEPPLRPSSADIDCMERAVACWAARHPQRRCQAVLLGVTPQIAEMKWPRGSSLIAADLSMPMVQGVWPGDLPNKRAACQANWLALPLRDSSRDVVIGDGSFSCVRYPHDCRALAAETNRVVREDGILVLRCYIQSARPERKEDVFEDLFRSAIPSFHWFKLRLLMAMQENAERGVAVDEVYRYWASRNIDESALSARTGWDAAVIRTIELYRGSDTVHSFPTMVELQSALSEFFEEIALSIPAHPMGDRCPILVARPRRVPGVAGCSR